jgi:hypothetical protein
LRSERANSHCFNLAVDSKLRSCDLLSLRVRDITHGERIAARAIDALEMAEQTEV